MGGLGAGALRRASGEPLMGWDGGGQRGGEVCGGSGENGGEERIRGERGREARMERRLYHIGLGIEPHTDWGP